MNILIVLEKDPSLSQMFEFSKVHMEQIKKIVPEAEITYVKRKQEAKKFIENSEIILTSDLGSIDLTKTPNLKWVHLTSAGVPKIPDGLKKSDVLISNSSGVHPVPIAEHVLAFMLMFARGIHKSYRVQIAQKKWLREGNLLRVFELSSKTVCIVGLGRIGGRVAKLAKAFDMKVVGIVRNPNKKVENVDLLYGIQELKKVLPQADFVVNILPGTDQTKNIFNKQIFKNFKKGAYYINVGRGTTTNEEDLIDALKSGKVAGAGLDVFETEPLSSKSPFWKMDNVIITPHYSGWTPEYMNRVVDIFCQNLKAFLVNKKMFTQVDKNAGY